MLFRLKKIQFYCQISLSARSGVKGNGELDPRPRPTPDKLVHLKWTNLDGPEHRVALKHKISAVNLKFLVAACMPKFQTRNKGTFALRVLRTNLPCLRSGSHYSARLRYFRPAFPGIEGKLCRVRKSTQSTKVYSRANHD